MSGEESKVAEEFYLSRRTENMTNRDVASEYLRLFCAGDVAGLAPLLAEDLHLNGPLFHFWSRDSYLDSLMCGPLENCGYRILSFKESAETVSIYYEYEKMGGVVTIAQLFKIRNGKICETLLVLDGRGIF
jgi:hypothetical protein